MESLKSDLKNVQCVIKDLLSQLSGELPIASWRFPEKLAASLDPLEELQSREEGLGGFKTLLMELLVDRLLFLLQCCVRFSEMSQGQKYTSLPLTLGSTVKKFARKIQHDYTFLRKATDKVLVREQRIAVLEAIVSDLQSQPHSHSIILPSQELLPIEPPSVIPYEALGTMKINRLSSSVATKPSTKPVTEVKRTPILTRGCSVSTQTTETGFALCLQCTGTHQTLVELADTVINVASTHKLKSELSTKDWGGLVSVGGLDTREWAECFTTDLKALSHRARSQECRVKELEEQLAERREVVLAMEGEITSLTAHVNHLQANVEEVRLVGHESLASSQRELGAQLIVLRDSVGQLETANSVVRKDLELSRKQESLLKARMAEIEARRTEVLRELQAVQSREMRLLSSQQTLERELEVAVGERAKIKEALEENKLQLTKTKIASQTMEKKNKAIFSKQTSLLSRLGQLDEECGNLQGRLWGVEHEREALCKELTDIQTHCTGLREELDTEKEKLSRSVREGERLRGVCCELEAEIRTAVTQLDTEKERCRLLMDYPFVKQTRTGYVEHIQSLSKRDSQKQISANTVRILLLEEQNSELRERGVAEVRERGTNSVPLLRAPVRTWRNGLLTQVHSEQAVARQAASGNQCSNDRGVPPMIRPQSSGSLKGRLGHLVTAIADHRSNVDS